MVYITVVNNVNYGIALPVIYSTKLLPFFPHLLL
jgi:hypothetical protein